MISFLLSVYVVAMYIVALIYWAAIKQPLTWKDILFLLAAPVTIPCKMVVILWILVRPPFSG